MSRLTLSIVQGASRNYPLRAQTTGGTVPTDFLDTDALSCRVWAGDAQPTLLTPAIAWTDASTARFRVSFDDADTANLAVGTYRIQALATRNGRSGLILDGRLEVLAAPGTAAAIPVYGDYQDLVDHAPWVGDLQSDEAEAGFLRQRGLAREWLDEILINRFTYADNGQLTMGMPGFGAWSMLAGGYDVPPSRWLRDQLAADKLIVRPRTLEICAKKALSYICKPQLGKQGDVSYRELAREFAADAANLVKVYRGEIDLDGDGWPDLTISCGVTNVR